MLLTLTLQHPTAYPQMDMPTGADVNTIAVDAWSVAGTRLFLSRRNLVQTSFRFILSTKNDSTTKSMEFDVLIYKKKWYSASVTIEADSIEEAREIAENEAGTYEYQEDGICEFIVDDIQQA
jgi:hypothetical protein